MPTEESHEPDSTQKSLVNFQDMDEHSDEQQVPDSDTDSKYQETILVHVSERDDGDMQRDNLSAVEESNYVNAVMGTEYPWWNGYDSFLRKFDKLRITYDDHGSTLNEYLDDTLAYLLERENRRCIRPDYLEVQNDLDINSRGVAINYLVLLSKQFELPPEVLHMAVDYMDRFLSKRYFPGRDLALLSATCLFMALRQEEIYTVSFNDLIWPSTMSKEEFAKFEWFVLKVLNFELYVPNVYTFVSMFAVKWKLPPDVEHASYYIIELALLELSLMEYKPSLIAVAAIALARYKLYLQLWTEECVEESGYKYEEFSGPYRTLLDLVNSTNSLVSTIQNKYLDVFQTFSLNMDPNAQHNEEIRRVDYTNDILLYLLLEEKHRSVRPDYMYFQTSMDPFTRALAVDSLAQLSDVFHVPSEVLHVAVEYMDRFLSDRYFPREDISLLSTTCFWIALQVKGVSVEGLAQLLRVDNEYHKNIMDFEKFVMKVLNFDLHVPNIYIFVSTFAYKWNLSREVEYVSYYIAELILLDVSFLKYKPSVLAVVAIARARFLLHSEFWTDECVAKSGYTREELLEPYIAVSVLVAGAQTFALSSIQRKYLNIFANFY